MHLQLTKLSPKSIYLNKLKYFTIFKEFTEQNSIINEIGFKLMKYKATYNKIT